MPTNEEITAALLVVRDRCERAGNLPYGPDRGVNWDGEMREITAAMLHAAKLVRDAKYEREVRKALNPDWGNGDEAS